jgi:hypothetical protein
MSKTSKTIIIILVIIVVGLLSRYVIFKNQIDAWGQGLDRISAWQTDYKKQHPNATKEEMDAAFNSGIDNIQKWKDDYKVQNPNATDAEVDAAFNATWKK